MKKIILLWWTCFLLYPSSAFSEKPYSPETMEKDLLKLKKKYQLDTVTIGETEKGNPIKAAKLGRGQKSILMVGAHHGREWLSTMILMKMLQDYAPLIKRVSQSVKSPRNYWMRSASGSFRC